MRFEERLIETRDGGQSCVLMAIPTSPLRITRQRLQRLRDDRHESHVDKVFMHEIITRAGRINAFVLRAKSADGEGSWEFADDLTDDEVQELAYLIVYSNLPIYRTFAANEVCGHFITGLKHREFIALVEGRNRVVSELEQELTQCENDDHQVTKLRLDIWLLKNFVYFLSFRSIDTKLDTFLSRSLSVLPGNLKSLKRLLDAVSYSRKSF
ncbi:MAG: hypothetical protein GY847_11620 [Proteobacteria bacterium]|nr:hypothetical protein [Pseudomonadota bacterium]